MKPAEKAKEIAENLYKKWGDSAYAIGAEYGATEMHEWDKQQFIDKACVYLMKHKINIDLIDFSNKMKE